MITWPTVFCSLEFVSAFFVRYSLKAQGLSRTSHVLEITLCPSLPTGSRRVGFRPLPPEDQNYHDFPKQHVMAESQIKRTGLKIFS